MVNRSLCIISAGFIALAGCSKDAPPTIPAAELTQPTAAESPPAPVVRVVPLRPFKDVIVSEVPEGEQRPPDTTMTGLSVGKLYEQVARSFDQIHFIDARGRKITYFATLKTDDGEIRIELLGDSAPNHVRNFIALARAGYYNGLPFHKSERRQVDDMTEAFIEAGCPLGTGELGYGSIGYWLKPEPSDELIHDDGVVGAVHSLVPRGDQLEDLDNAACKFYIALSKAKWRDQTFTIFGKIVQGKEIAHTISKRPNQTERGLEDRPARPAMIREVIIEEVSAAGSQIAASK
jgi:peptidyl-prolyl cis-trans isomerase B (cyclophilin B)